MGMRNIINDIANAAKAMIEQSGDGEYVKFFSTLQSEKPQDKEEKAQKAFRSKRNELLQIVLKENQIAGQRLWLSKIRDDISPDSDQNLNLYDVKCNLIFTSANQLSRELKKRNSWWRGNKKVYESGTDFVKKVGEYVQYELTQQPAYIQQKKTSSESFTRLLQLTFLKESPEFFLLSQNKLLAPRITAISNTLLAMKRTAQSIRANTKNDSERVNCRNQLTTDKQNIGNELNKIDQEIKKLSGWRTWGFIGFISGNNKKLAQLKGMQKLLAPVVTNISQSIEKSTTDAVLKKYEEEDGYRNAKQELKKTKLITNPSECSEQDVRGIRASVVFLLNCSSLFLKTEMQEAAKGFVDELEKKIISSMNELSTPGLNKQLAFFEYKLVSDNDELNNARKKLVDAIKNKVSQFNDPLLACNYIDDLKKSNASILFETPESFNKFVDDSLVQHQAWAEIKTSLKQLDAPHLRFSADKVFVNVTAALEKNSPALMKQDAEELIEKVQEAVIEYIKNEYRKDFDAPRMRSYLQLFQLEKTTLPNENLQALTSARNEVVKASIDYINGQPTPMHTAVAIDRLQNIWPDAFEANFIEIENKSGADVKILTGQRLDQFSNKEIGLDSEAKNYVVCIGDVTLAPGEKRTFFCSPVINDKNFQQFIDDKYKNISSKVGDLITRIESGFAKQLNFLKTGEKSFAKNAWDMITGNTQTALTVENQNSYVSDLINRYVSTLDNAAKHFADTKAVTKWIQKHIVKDVEDIAKDLNTNLDNLLYLPERKKATQALSVKLDPIDIGRMLLQWQFINEFRKKFGNIDPSLNTAYRNVGMGIIYKMDEIAKMNPRFIHEVLGNMTRDQLNALNDTFVADSTEDTGGNLHQLLNANFGTSQAVTGSAGQTALRRSMLLSQVSALVTQELVDFLNEDKRFNETLFKEHIAFICGHLSEKKERENELNKSSLGKQLRENIKISILARLSKHLNSEEFLIKLEELRDALKNPRQLKAHFSTVANAQAIIENLNQIINVISKHQDITTISSALDNVNEFINKQEFIAFEKSNKLSKSSKLSEDFDPIVGLKNKYKKANTQDDFNLVDFIKNLPTEIIDEIGSHQKELAPILVHMQSAFADRFTGPLNRILSQENLETVNNVNDKLKRLKGNEFYKLICQVMPDSADRDAIFKRTQSTRPVAISKKKAKEEANLLSQSPMAFVNNLPHPYPSKQAGNGLTNDDQHDDKKDAQDEFQFLMDEDIRQNPRIS